LDPNFPIAHWLLGETNAYDSRVAESLIHFEKAVELSGGTLWFLPSLGWAHGLNGDEDKAQEILAELFERSRREYVSPFDYALIRLGLGEKDAALDLLEQSFEARDPNMMSIHYYPTWDDFRSDPRFIDLVERVGVAAQARAE
ncbi:MAG: hypothetical protein PVG79_08030, partial [Gemmatimonadales bacterium]